MNVDTLTQKRSATEARFNELVEQKKQIEEELLKLQGEYRVYTAQIDELTPKTSDQANTIVAESKEEKKSGK